MRPVTITAKSTIFIEPSQQGSRLRSTLVELDFDKKLDQSVYFEKDQLTLQGAKALTNALVQGVVANIHSMHKTKTWDSAEHLRFAIAELERGFALANTHIIF